MEALLKLIKFARLWASARLSGDLLSVTRQRAVLRALASQIFRVLGGDRWGDAEAARDRAGGLKHLKQSVSTKPGEGSIGAAIALKCKELASVPPEARPALLVELVGRHMSLPKPKTELTVIGPTCSGGARILRSVRIVGPNDTLWLAEFALRLGTDPGRVEAWAGAHLRAGLIRLLGLPTIARAARFLTLVIDQHLDSRAAAGNAGWKWL